MSLFFQLYCGTNTNKYKYKKTKSGEEGQSGRACMVDAYELIQHRAPRMILMSFRYYPGCTLKTKAKDLDIYARRSAEALGVELIEISQWQCCGAVYPQAQDEIATRLSAIRTLDEARREESDLLTICSACHHVITRINHDMQANADIRAKANNYLALDTPYAGQTRVVHYLEMLRDTVGFGELKNRVTNPLLNRKIGAFYGCMLLRPSAVLQFDNPENPSVMEGFLDAIGAEPVVFSYRNECCGGYVAMEEKSLVEELCNRIMDSARQKGAEALITACPLCRYNLNKNATKHQVPVYYFTELLAEALGVKDIYMNPNEHAT